MLPASCKLERPDSQCPAIAIPLVSFMACSLTLLSNHHNYKVPVSWRSDVLAAVNINTTVFGHVTLTIRLVTYVHFGAKELRTKLEAANFSETSRSNFIWKAAFPYSHLSSSGTYSVWRITNSAFASTRARPYLHASFSGRPFRKRKWCWAKHFSRLGPIQAFVLRNLTL